MREELHEPLLLELPEGLTDGSPTDAQLRGQGNLEEAGPRRDVAADDAGSEVDEDVLAQDASLCHRAVRFDDHHGTSERDADDPA